MIFICLVARICENCIKNLLMKDFEGILSYYTPEQNPTLADVIAWNIRDISGNAFEVICIRDGQLYNLILPIW
jgi:hypothetical protein